jgi:cytochrome c oxidase cbb3-type subunit 2
MPAFRWLFDADINGEKTGDKMAARRHVGVPYTDEDIAGAAAAVNGKKEIDALVAYLQQLGTLLQTKR